MSSQKDDSNPRRVETTVDIQATPEAVWKAIASGPGVKSWFMGMESEFDEHAGGSVRTKMGDQLIEVAKVTAWDPPRHFATEGANAFGPDSPTIGYEWTVEANEGGHCTLRMVQTLFTEDDAWDTQVGDTKAGWPAFFHVLKNYVERHADQPSGVAQAMAPVSGSKEEEFERLTAALGATELAKGARVHCTTEGAPAFSGEIEDIVHGRSNRIMIRLDKPFAGTGWLGVGPISGEMRAIATLYYYGDGAEEAGARDGEQLTGWLQAHGETVTS